MDPKDEAKIRGASSEAARQVRELLCQSDVNQLKHLQLLALGRLQDSNAVLSHLNDFSERSFAAVANDFAKNTRLVKSMKEDLDYIFTRIRVLKARLASQYPNAFSEANKTEMLDQRPDLEEPIEKS